MVERLQDPEAVLGDVSRSKPHLGGARNGHHRLGSNRKGPLECRKQFALEYSSWRLALKPSRYLLASAPPSEGLKGAQCVHDHGC